MVASAVNGVSTVGKHKIKQEQIGKKNFCLFGILEYSFILSCNDSST